MIKKTLLVLGALATLSTMAYADMYTGETYECTFYDTIKKKVIVIDGGEIAMIGDIILFRVKGIIYSGVNHEGDKLYMIVHHKDNIVEIGGASIASTNGTCIEAKD